MPILEYACESCGNHFDKLIRGMNVSNPDVACPSCGGNEVEKQVSTPSHMPEGLERNAGQLRLDSPDYMHLRDFDMIA